MRYRTSEAGQRAKPSYAGVRRDPRWDTFEGFVANQPPGAGYEVGLVLSRLGDTGDYSPENCRWATKAMNTREWSEARMIRLPDGRFAMDVAHENGLTRTWRARVKNGWDVERAVTQPVRPLRRR